MFDDFDTQVTCEEYYNDYGYDPSQEEYEFKSQKIDENYLIDNDYFDDIPF